MDAVAFVGPVRPAFPVGGGPDPAVVATRLRWPDRWVGCPAAPLLAGALRRRGVRVVTGPLTVGAAPSADTVATIPPGLLGDPPAADQPVAALAYLEGSGPHIIQEVRAVAARWRLTIRPRDVLLVSPAAMVRRPDTLRTVVDRADLVLVVGAANSSSSARLVDRCVRQRVPAYLVEDASHVDLAWLISAGTVGITAGASTSAARVDEVIATLCGLGPVAVQVDEA